MCRSALCVTVLCVLTLGSCGKKEPTELPEPPIPPKPPLESLISLLKIQSLREMSSRIQPGMVLEITDAEETVYATPADAFEHPHKLLDPNKSRVVGRGTYRNYLDWTLEAGTALGLFGTARLEVQAKANGAATMITKVGEVVKHAIDKGRLEDAGLRKRYRDKLRTKGIYVVQAVYRPKLVEILFYSTKGASVEVDVETIKASVHGGASVTRGESGEMILEDLVLGFNQWYLREASTEEERQAYMAALGAEGIKAEARGTLIIAEPRPDQVTLAPKVVKRAHETHALSQDLTSARTEVAERTRELAQERTERKTAEGQASVLRDKLAEAGTLEQGLRRKIGELETTATANKATITTLTDQKEKLHAAVTGGDSRLEALKKSHAADIRAKDDEIKNLKSLLKTARNANDLLQIQLQAKQGEITGLLAKIRKLEARPGPDPDMAAALKKAREDVAGLTEKLEAKERTLQQYATAFGKPPSRAGTVTSAKGAAVDAMFTGTVSRRESLLVVRNRLPIGRVIVGSSAKRGSVMCKLEKAKVQKGDQLWR